MLARILERFRETGPNFEDPKYMEAAACLHELALNHAFIDLRRDSDIHQVRSMILDVSPMDGYFHIDQPFPPELEAYLLVGHNFTVASSLPDGPVHFSTRILQRLDDAEGHSFQCTIPGHIDRNQRRQDFRLNVEPTDGIHAELKNPEAPSATAADVLNLSAAGIRLRTGQHEDWLHKKRCSLQCRLNLGGRCSIRCGLTMRNVEIDEEQPEHWQIGASFAGLDRYQRRQLGRYIAQRQRQQICGAA